MKCKNIECINVIIGKRVYCSLSCRNYYVNKYIRDYTKISKTLSDNYKEKYIPNKCKLCNNNIPYDNRESEYCSKICSKKTINMTNRKGMKYTLSENTLDKLNLIREKYNENPKKCKFCMENLIYEKRVLRYCSTECCKSYRRKDMNDFKIYKAETNFKFSLNDYPDEFDFKLIEKHGWYSPSNKNNNLGGVSRDHMIAVRDGFNLGIDPKLLSHPANCKLMIHNENISKHKTSSINITELLQRIEDFNIKYN
jgi:hypothetical protein